MKEPLLFPPHIQVSKWLKDLIVEMMTIDEFKRIGIKQVLEIVQKNSKEMDLEWFEWAYTVSIYFYWAILIHLCSLGPVRIYHHYFFIELYSIIHNFFSF